VLFRSAPDGLHEDELVEVGTFLPVRIGKSLAAKGAIAGLAEKALDTLWEDLSPVGAYLLIAPARS